MTGIILNTSLTIWTSHNSAHNEAFRTDSTCIQKGACKLTEPHFLPHPLSQQKQMTIFVAINHRLKHKSYDIKSKRQPVDIVLHKSANDSKVYMLSSQGVPFKKNKQLTQVITTPATTVIEDILVTPSKGMAFIRHRPIWYLICRPCGHALLACLWHR